MGKQGTTQVTVQKNANCVIQTKHVTRTQYTKRVDFQKGKGKSVKDQQSADSTQFILFIIL